ncbi:MAG: threonine aldolase family protein [Oscillospiraceae bacterium]
MVRFESDYTEGAAPELLRRLTETNLEQTSGYGEDCYCDAAREKIREACDAPDAAVHFLLGGTQTNTTLLSAALRPHQGALCPSGGHISIHESGAIENTGHKVLVLPSGDGKLTAAAVDDFCRAHWEDPTFEHMVQPGLVYLSFPTENGLLYTKAELEALRRVCDQWELVLYADGARLGYALAAEENDVTLPDLYRLTDAFYIGGTKVGALFGEALVIRSDVLRRDFRYLIKQRGGLLAKGRLLGLQFDALFTDGLYLRLGRHAVEQALRIRDGLRACGCAFLNDSPTNQQFPILPDEVLRELEKDFTFSPWGSAGEGKSAVRFCTSWATKSEDVDALLAALRRLL